MRDCPEAAVLGRGVGGADDLILQVGKRVLARCSGSGHQAWAWGSLGNIRERGDPCLSIVTPVSLLPQQKPTAALPFSLRRTSCSALTAARQGLSLRPVLLRRVTEPLLCSRHVPRCLGGRSRLCAPCMGALRKKAAILGSASRCSGAFD